MQKLLQLDGSLGEELRRLETLRCQLRKRGAQKDEGPFQGPAVEAERHRLAGTTKIDASRLDWFSLSSPPVL